jgi:hypothetical protein
VCVVDPTKYSTNEKEAIIRRYTSELVRKNFIGPSIVSHASGAHKPSIFQCCPNGSVHRFVQVGYLTWS